MSYCINNARTTVLISSDPLLPESGDPGNVLRDSENAVHQNASAIDDAMNL